MVSYMTGLAYLGSLMTFQGGKLLGFQLDELWNVQLL